MQKYYQNESKLNGVYSRNNLPIITDGAYVINLDEFKSIETHWIASYILTDLELNMFKKKLQNS